MRIISTRRILALAALAALTLLLQGCSEMEPRHGTRVTIAFPAGKPLGRKQLMTVSQYLVTKGRLVLGVRNPRVDEVQKGSLVLLLPGRKVSLRNVRKLVDPSSIDLYHLTRVATRKSPNRPWKLKVPPSVKSGYLFVGPKGQRIDSRKDGQALLSQVVGQPSARPLLTAEDIRPDALAQQMGKEWAVQVRFTSAGARKFEDFTKRNRGEYLAVFYNGRLVSAPVVGEPIRGGAAMITGFATANTAQEAVNEINAGSLPAQIRITRVEYY